MNMIKLLIRKINFSEAQVSEQTHPQEENKQVAKKTSVIAKLCVELLKRKRVPS